MTVYLKAKPVPVICLGYGEMGSPLAPKRNEELGAVCRLHW